MNFNYVKRIPGKWEDFLHVGQTVSHRFTQKRLCKGFFFLFFCPCEWCEERHFAPTSRRKGTSLAPSCVTGSPSYWSARLGGLRTVQSRNPALVPGVDGDIRRESLVQRTQLEERGEGSDGVIRVGACCAGWGPANVRQTSSRVKRGCAVFLLLSHIWLMWEWRVETQTKCREGSANEELRTPQYLYLLMFVFAVQLILLLSVPC